MTRAETESILYLDLVRRRRYSDDYDPISGRGCTGQRTAVPTPPGFICPEARVPEAMTADPAYAAARLQGDLWSRLRIRYDFEYWCAVCVTVRDKLSGRNVPLILNRPQRRVAAVLESDRTAGRPIRMILLKARQWGGSTLVQMYMAWIQLCHRENWHSLICAHVKDTAATIRGMYTNLLRNYPERLWEGDSEPEFASFERASNIREIRGRGCRVTLGSAESPESVRGNDYAMAHLSETAFWPATTTRSPDRFIQAICGGIALTPCSLIVMESTANGVGNYFHSEWLRCKEGHGDKHAVFVPWYEIDIYRLEPDDPATLAAGMTGYEQMLWEMGLTLDRINWYRHKRREYASDEQMSAEFPTTDTEAFVNSGYGVFDHRHIDRLRCGCRKPLMQGELRADGPTFSADSRGALSVWKAPEPGREYVVAVDVGGRSLKADWSVVAVLSVPDATHPLPEVVAQWRGHTDHDLLAEKCRQTALYYNEGLLIVESNTFETAEYNAGASPGDSNLFVLNRLAEVYPNIYRRRSYDRATNTDTTRVGFHTNRQTKTMLIDGLIEAVRECSYIERCEEACNELTTYEQQPNGAYAAKAGYHDDILMTRALALHAIGTAAPPPASGFTFPTPGW